MALPTAAMSTDVTKLYVALFGRAPDAEGLGYWTQQLAGGKSLVTVTNEMYDVPAARDYYPKYFTAEQIVESFYENVLGRVPDAEGKTHWVKRLTTTGNIGAVIQEIIGVVDSYSGTDVNGLFSKALFANKVAVGLYYASKKGDVAGASDILRDVTDKAVSVDKAKGIIDGPTLTPFTLTASAPTVTEGDAGTTTLSFRLELNSAPTEAVSVNVSTNVGGATAGVDYTPVSSVVTFAAGQQVQFVNVQVIGDTTFEQNETVSLTISGARLSQTVTATGTITNDDIDPATVAKSIALTTGLDNLSGGAGNDTFDGSLNSSSAVTYQASDIVNGGAGTDTLIAAFNSAAASTVTPSGLTSVENLRVTNSGAGAVTVSLAQTTGVTEVGSVSSTGDVSFTGATGVSAVRAQSNTGNVSVTNDVASLAGAADNQSVTLSGAAGTLTLARSSATSPNVLETVTLNAVDSASTLAGLTITNLGATKVTVTGSQNLTVTAITDATSAGASVKTLDASALAGSLVMGSGTSSIDGTGAGVTLNQTTGASTDTLNLGTNATITGGAGNDVLIGGAGNDVMVGGAGNDAFWGSAAGGAAGNDSMDGGAGNDTFYVGTGLSIRDTIVGGDGTDTLVLGTAATTGSTGSARNVSGIETVTLNVDVAQDMAAFDSTVNRVNMGVAGTAYDFTNASASVATMGVTANVTAALSRAADTAADALTVSIGSATSSTGRTIAQLTVNNEETVTLSASGLAVSGTFPTHTVTSLVDSSATILKATGAANLTLTATTTPLVTTVDASAMTGQFSMGAAVNALNVTITGGAHNDTLMGGAGNDVIVTGEGNNNVNAGDGRNSITGGSANDLITSGTGNDTIDAGAGNDLITFGTGTDSVVAGDGTDQFFASGSDFSSSDVIDGGAGSDSLNITAATTLTDTLAARLKGIETINAVSGATSITLTDAVMTANGAASLAIRNYGFASATTAAAGTPTAYNTAALTVDASALSSANTVTITSSSGAVANDSLVGGNGNDSFTYLWRTGAGNALDANDTVSGGNGTDTLTLNAATAGVGITAFLGAGVTGIERVVIGANAGTTNVTTDASNLTGYQNMTVDASAMTSTAYQLTFDGSAESETTATYTVTVGAGGSSVTGGSGNDTFTGGLGADTLIGGAGRDSLVGGAGADSIIGGADNDIIDGGSGDNRLDGGTGNDVITAGAGNDTITSGAGADNITGGDGNDTYSYLIATDSLATGSISTTVTSQASLDTINGFNPGGGTASTIIDVVSASVAITSIQTATVPSANINSLGGDLAANATLAAAPTGSATVVTVSSGTAAGTYLVLNADGTTGYAATTDTVIRLVDAVNISNLTTSNFSSTVGNLTTLAAAGSTFTGTSVDDTLDVQGLTTLGALNGGGGTNTLQASNGANISGSVITNFTNLTLASGASITVTPTQNTAFTGTITAPGTNTITLSTNGTTTGLANIETYALGGTGSVFTIGHLAQNVTGTNNADNVTFISGAYSGTAALADGTNTITLNNGADISGGTVSVVGAGTATATITSGGSVTVNATQFALMVATGAITAAGTETITLSNAYTTTTNTNSSAVENIQLANVANTPTLSNAAQNVTGGTSTDDFSTAANLTGVINGGNGADSLAVTGATTITALDIRSVDTLNLNDAGNAQQVITLAATATGLTSVLMGDATDTFTASPAQLSALTTLNVGSTGDGAIAAGSAGTVDLTGTTIGAGGQLASITAAAAGNAFRFTTAGFNKFNAVTGGIATTDSVELTTASAGTTDLNRLTLVETVTLSLATGTYAYTPANTVVAAAANLTINASALTTGTLNLDGSNETNGTYSVTGGAGADTIIGGAGADTLSGGNGADSITGGAGGDSITLGAGADTVVYSGSTDGARPTSSVFTLASSDTVSDFSTGDLIGISSALVTNAGIRSVASGAGVNLTTGSGVVVITGAVVNDFTNATSAVAAIGGVTAANTEKGIFIINNSAGTRAGVYQYVENGTAANAITVNSGTAASNELILLGVITTDHVLTTTDLVIV